MCVGVYVHLTDPTNDSMERVRGGADDLFISSAYFTADETPDISLDPASLYPSSTGYFR